MRVWMIVMLWPHCLDTAWPALNFLAGEHTSSPFNPPAGSLGTMETVPGLGGFFSLQLTPSVFWTATQYDLLGLPF